MSRIERRVVCFILALVVGVSASGPFEVRAQSTDLSPFSILRLEPSARAAALGGSFGTAAQADINAFYYNPASLNDAMHGTLALTYLNHISDLSAGFLAYAHDFPGVATFATSLRYLSWGDIQGADADGNETSRFSPSDMVVSIGAAIEYVPDVRLGATVHGLYSSMASYSASAIAADAGVLWTPGGGNTSIGLSLHNIGHVMSNYGRTDDRLPADLRLSISHRLQHLPLLVSITGRNLQSPGEAPDGISGFSSVMRHFTFGGEFQFSDAFNVRFGYNHRSHQDLKMNARLDLAGVGMGFGLRVNRFYLDYAFNSWSTLGSLHQLGVRTRI